MIYQRQGNGTWGCRKWLGFNDLQARDLAFTEVTDAGMKELARLNKLQWPEHAGLHLPDMGLKERKRRQADALQGSPGLLAIIFDWLGRIIALAPADGVGCWRRSAFEIVRHL